MTTNSITLYANPYDIDASGFYFSSLEDYQEKYDNNVNRYGQPVEEYMIDFIDGEYCDLFNACSVDQSNLELFFNDIETLDDHLQVEMYYRCTELGENMQDALDNLDLCGSIFCGTVQEYTDDYIDSTGMLDSLPENLRYYFDTEKFARDLALNSEIDSFEYDNVQYIASGF